ncbi:GGDEF domain-containing protein [Alicyclobacillus fastidiosus]|uniref:GGDEF domain-containing protein n=2 Tax=Alicyclobacillus fastidiosus TaxID=392011 RepID=A0ABY6ZNU9_9BACL|nr:sensor domain-containing diguanylate cyclase [Alicyclobacillus fastidiosus]WAH44554.1 GGDEF domain-containing protein [Alicyclobacillus fastidiosus]
MNSLLDVPSSKGQLYFASIIAALLFLVFFATLPFSRHQSVIVTPFLPSVLSIMSVSELITAFLLFVQFVVSPRLPMLILAVTYLYSGMIIIPHLLAFPGVFSNGGLMDATSQTAIWLWVFWHSGFPLGLSLYGLSNHLGISPSFKRQNSALIAVVGMLLTLICVVGVSWLAFRGTHHLPTIVQSGDYHLLVTSGVGPVVFLINLFCVSVMLYRFKRVSIMHLGVTLASLASLLDVSLTLFTGGRYMVGWYVARYNSLLASLILLSVLLTAITQLYRKLAIQQWRITYLAYHDPLTGLANRRFFSETIAELYTAENEQFCCAILMLDLDGFKQVNDKFGHDTGDKLLKETAVRLNHSVREEDMVARLGGDEFILLVTSAKSVADVKVIAARIMDMLQRPILIGKNVIQVTASVGIALRPDDGKNYPDLLRNADEALYQAKERGKNRYAFYVPRKTV